MIGWLWRWWPNRNPEPYQDPPTEEHEIVSGPYMQIGPRLEDFGPGKPLPIWETDMLRDSNREDFGR